MISKKEIESIPLKGNVDFRERSIAHKNSALLIVDVQKGEYNQEFIKDNPILTSKYLLPETLNISSLTSLLY